jgi:hypothetical protein
MDILKKFTYFVVKYVIVLYNYTKRKIMSGLPKKNER